MAPVPPAETLSPFRNTVGALVKGEVLTVSPQTSVAEAARRISESGVGSLVVVGEANTPEGILTKTDLVSRVLVPGRDPSTPVGEVCSRNLVTVERGRPIFDGLLLMIRHNIGHLVVTEQGRLVGIVSERDWLTFQERHPAALLRGLETAPDIATLAHLRSRVMLLVRNLFGREGTAEALTGFVTEINDRVSRRVIDLCLRAESAQGRLHDVPFTWVSLGSEGRAEQTLSTDQDNALVFADVPEGETEAVRQSFLRLAAQVVDGLEVCGFPRCKGNVMASNPDLCLPLAAWKAKFTGYLEDPDPEALLRSSIYFDLRCLYGESWLVDALWEHLLERMRTHRGFLRHLAGQVMAGRPPVDTFGWRLRSLLGVDHKPLDLKQQALAPLVACLRVLALSAGSRETNTLGRLRAVQACGVIPEHLAPAVAGAYDFLMLLRLRRHFRLQALGVVPDNLLVVEELDRLQRGFLVEALSTVIELQEQVFGEFGGLQAM